MHAGLAPSRNGNSTEAAPCVQGLDEGWRRKSAFTPLSYALDRFRQMISARARHDIVVTLSLPNSDADEQMSDMRILRVELPI